MRKVNVVNVRGRPPVKWENRVLEYLIEREDGRERTGVCEAEVYGQEKW